MKTIESNGEIEGASKIKERQKNHDLIFFVGSHARS
jgi:hypothetical protein